MFLTKLCIQSDMNLHNSLGSNASGITLRKNGLRMIPFGTHAPL